METVIQDYQSQGVRFYYVYKALAHPELHGYVTPYTLEERLMHVREAEKRIGSQAAWLCDNMVNDMKHAFGDAPNSEFIIDPAGKVVRRRVWSRPEELRADLEELVGPVENPTRVEDLKVRFEPPPKVAASGVVERPELPANLQPLRIEPIQEEGSLPFYVKLRAEATGPALSGEKGKLYLGFHLDPLYQVHWNNLVEPVRYEIETAGDVQVVPAQGEGPKVEEPADVDPREFLLDIEAGRGRDRDRPPLKVTVRYFACNDDEGWCLPVSQEYLVYLELDRDGGRPMRGREFGGGRNRPAIDRPRPLGAIRPGVGQQIPAGMVRIRGEVLSANLQEKSIKVRTQAGQVRTFLVPESTPINRDNQPGNLNDLQPGDQIMLGVSEASLENQGLPTAFRIMARSPN